MRVLLIDNHDSFTYNLAHDIAVVTGAWPDVVLNDAPVTEAGAWFGGYDAIAVSPGPGTPQRASDLGHSLAAVQQGDVPVLGVCLGHQAIGHVYGAEVTRAPRPVHGEVADLLHEGTGLFAGLPNPLWMVRYHSLVVTDLPSELVVDAVLAGDEPLVMALHHHTRPLWGVQTHPESISSEHGRALIANFLQLAREWNAVHRSPARPAGAGEITEPGERGAVAGAQTQTQTEVRGGPQTGSLEGPQADPEFARVPGPVRGDGDGDDTEAGQAVRHVVAERVAWRGDVEHLFDTLFRGDDHAWWLDSALSEQRGRGGGRFSFMGSAAGPLARIVTAGGAASPLEVVERDLASAQVTVEIVGSSDELGELPFGFQLGWVGYLGYESPGAELVFADRAVVVDHRDADAWVLALLPGGGPRGAVEGVEDVAHVDDIEDVEDVEAAQRSWLRETVAHLAGGGIADESPAAGPGVAPVPRNTTPPLRAGGTSPSPASVTVRHTREDYLALVERCLEHIVAGESYELCLTNQITVEMETDPWRLYRRLRATSPRPFAAYLAFGQTHVLSASPERFLRVGDVGAVGAAGALRAGSSATSAGAVEAKPIKGTRPRGATPAEDEALAAELASDPKELAENLMIVDLLRNDLGRVCRVGSVHAPVLFDVETYEGVHQLVSTIRGELDSELTSVDAVRAAFPGGSMTGAPKERSVRILRELEGGRRGVYAGAIGYFSLSGAADWSIVIRSIVWHADHLTYGTGGAVTARSDPESEWHETVVKARTLGAALGLDLDEVLPRAARTASYGRAASAAEPRP